MQAIINIIYNPYKVETIISVNGENLKSQRIIERIKDKRLQYWIDKGSNNWDGLFSELCKELNVNALHINFEGRKIDFDDLCFIAKKYNNKYDINLEYENIKEDEDKLKKIDDFFNELEKTTIEELKTPEIFRLYEDVKSSKFKINVIATMSSGKSTLINSILGREILPSKNEACTATITRITDNKNMDEFYGLCKDKNENIICKKQVIDLAKMKEFNENERVTYIDLEGDMPNISAGNLSLMLVDTPGPNNSRNENHKTLTEKIIYDNSESKGIVLYVMNATQFGTNDDEQLLRQIASSMKFGGKQSKDRFLFAVNKCDEIDPESDDESVEGLLEKVKEYLKEFEIEEPNIFPISAKICKDIRKFRKDNNSITRNEKRNLEAFTEDSLELDRLHFEKIATLSESVKYKLQQRLKIAEDENNEFEQALIHSGVPTIEETINEYLEKYAYPIKIQNSINKINAIITEVIGKIELDQRIANDEKELKKVQENIGKLNEVISQSREIDNLKSIKEKLNQSWKRKFEIEKRLSNKTIESFFNIYKEGIENISSTSFKGRVKAFIKGLDSTNAGLLKKLFNGFEYGMYYSAEADEYEAQELSNKLKEQINTIFKERNESLNIFINELSRKIAEEMELNFNKFITLFQGISPIKFNISEVVCTNTFEKEINFDELVEKYSKIESYTVDDREWWKPWTWFGKNSSHEEERKMLNTNNFIQSVYKEISDVNKSFWKSTEEEINTKINIICSNMENKLNQIYNILKEKAEMLSNELKSGEIIQKRLNKNKEKNDIIIHFKKLIDEILDM